MSTIRIIYRFVHATAEENQNGTFHYSEPFKTLDDARRALKNSKAIGDDFVGIEKCHQILREPPSGFVYKNPDNEWEIDHEAGGCEWVEQY